jgi:dolichol kinase
MVNQITVAILYLFAISFLLVFNELIYRRLGLKGEITRKFAHFTATLSTVTFPYLFTDHWYVLVLALAFFLVLFISRNGTQLKSIHDIDRKSVGSYLLPLSIYLTFLFSNLLDNKFLYILPIIILAVCDPMAGILGINLKVNNHKISIFGIKTKKTVLGSGSFLLSSFIISIIALYFNRMVFDLKTFWLALAIALVSTIAEMLSWRGSDNLFIPVSVLVMLILFL